MINFKLAAIEARNPSTDDMNRRWVGWSPTLSDQELFDHNRGVWALAGRAARERVLTLSHDGTVRVVAAVNGVQSIPSKTRGVRAKSALVGRILGPGDPVYDELIGTAVDRHRNPVSYRPDPGSAGRTCGCGCGSPVPSHRVFVAGHDQRAIHDRIARQWGSSLEFIKWFDANFPESVPAA